MVDVLCIRTNPCGPVDVLCIRTNPCGPCVDTGLHESFPSTRILLRPMFDHPWSYCLPFHNDSIMCCWLLWCISWQYKETIVSRQPLATSFCVVIESLGRKEAHMPNCWNDGEEIALSEFRL